MRKFAGFLGFIGALFILSGVILNYQLTLSNNYQDSKKNIQISIQNPYYRDYNFAYIENTENTNPSNYNELLNLIYSVLNDGYDKFTFYCSDSYEGCLDDVV